MQPARLSIVQCSPVQKPTLVRDPQKLVAINKEYFGSRFQLTDKIEKTPNTKLPITLTISIFNENVSKIMGEDAILYLRKAPRNGSRSQ